MAFLVQRIIIVPASHVEAARAIGAAIGPAGARMYTTGASPTGKDPVTHYLSAGLMKSDVADLLQSVPHLYTAAQQGAAAQGIPFNVTVQEAEYLAAHSIVAFGDPWVALEAAGLQLVD